MTLETESRKSPQFCGERMRALFIEKFFVLHTFFFKYASYSTRPVITDERGYRMSEQDYLNAVQEQQAMLFRVAYTILHNHEDCADALQDALEKAWRKKDEIRNPELFRSWMARIVINCSRDMLRKRKVTFVCLDENLPVDEVEDLQLSDTLNRLEESLRLPLVLHYMENLSVAEIAQAMRLPQGTIRNRLHRGRKKLAKLYREEEMVW